jgi:hypothetical protein
MGESLITHISTGHNHSDLMTKVTSGVNADAYSVVSCMTYMMTIHNIDGKTSLSRPPDLEGTEEICPCVLRRLMTGHRE